MLGLPFMPWQRQVADVAGEVTADGLPAYGVVVVTVPRQSGKTTLELTEVNDTAIERDGARMGFCMQTGFEAHKKLVNDWQPVMVRSKLWPLVDRFYRSTADTAIAWHNGSRVDVVATSASAGHGLTLDKVFLDEVWAYVDDSMEQSMLPTMATKPHSQLWIVSTAGTAQSHWFRRKIEAGRRAAEDDVGSGTAYFEWSAADGEDPYEPATWWGCMPALGHTMSERKISEFADGMSEQNFRRAFLNQWVQGEAGLIPMAMWEQVLSETAVPDHTAATFAADVSHDRSSWAIAVSDGSQLELVDYNRGGLSGLVDRCDELRARYGSPVLIDGSGPGSGLADRSDALLDVSSVQASDAAMRFYDAVMDAKVRVRPHTALTAAVEGAVKRERGDRWGWSRKGSLCDVSPLVAASIALGGTPEESDKSGFAFVMGGV